MVVVDGSLEEDEVRGCVMELWEAAPRFCP